MHAEEQRAEAETRKLIQANDANANAHKKQTKLAVAKLPNLPLPKLQYRHIAVCAGNQEMESIHTKGIIVHLLRRCALVVLTVN